MAKTFVTLGSPAAVDALVAAGAVPALLDQLGVDYSREFPDPTVKHGEITSDAASALGAILKAPRHRALFAAGSSAAVALSAIVEKAGEGSAPGRAAALLLRLAGAAPVAAGGGSGGVAAASGPGGGGEDGAAAAEAARAPTDPEAAGDAGSGEGAGSSSDLAADTG